MRLAPLGYRAKIPTHPNPKTPIQPALRANRRSAVCTKNKYKLKFHKTQNTKPKTPSPKETASTGLSMDCSLHEAQKCMNFQTQKIKCTKPQKIIYNIYCTLNKLLYRSNKLNTVLESIFKKSQIMQFFPKF